MPTAGPSEGRPAGETVPAAPGALPAPNPSERAAGLAYALAAYLTWGLSPVYFKTLRHVPALEILSHRILWSVVLLAGILIAGRRLGTVAAAVREPRRLAVLGITTALISANWLLYIWAVNSGRLLEASLGYFINPLVNVVLGVVFLRESLTRVQLASVLIAALGVLALLVQLGQLPWISLALALSFGVYGLLRKRAAIDAIAGLFVETALLAPLALLFVGARAAAGAGAFGGDAPTSLLLAAAGPITALPLVWFGLGVRRLRLSTMGLVQYVGPTCQFLLAVLLYREPFGAAHALAFALIWASLALYTADALRRTRPR